MPWHDAMRVIGFRKVWQARAFERRLASPDDSMTQRLLSMWRSNDVSSGLRASAAMLAGTHTNLQQGSALVGTAVSSLLLPELRKRSPALRGKLSCGPTCFTYRASISQNQSLDCSK